MYEVRTENEVLNNFHSFLDAQMFAKKYARINNVVTSIWKDGVKII